ncbi:MAG: tRNA pseudouridine(54/55) synthase Pus10 [Candidatus Aenigmarchaeota archaeon]|nr:tRNA pseudouridine(54/55) synthase Pus10 [Candidatus Aenigmarchaeota archaeon]
MKLDNFVELLKMPICDSCLGRNIADILSGYTNEERGKAVRMYVAFLLDSGEKLDVDLANFHGIKFRNIKLQDVKPEKCKVCKKFFREKVNGLAKAVAKKLRDMEFDTFLVGSIPSNEMLKNEETMNEIFGIEFSEPIKSEINRELGKRIEKLTRRKFNLRSPDVTILVDLNTDSVKLQVKSLCIHGEYQKLVRGIPQTKWVCSNCQGKGCIKCKGEGKLYKTSIQEIIEKTLIKAAKSRGSSFHGAGREDVDAMNFGWRQFVIEMERPKKRKVDVRKIERMINKSGKVKVRKLRIVKDGNELIRKLKTDRHDKTYRLEIEFEKDIDRRLLKNLKSLAGSEILQKTPTRVVHRRANKTRKRYVKKISYKIVGKSKLVLTVRTDAGLYVKELVTGDEGRTQPNVSELISNKVKSLKLDVIKIHSSKD